MSGAKLTFEGGDEMRAKLARIVSEMPNRVGAALYAEAETGIMNPSKSRYVPVDTGTLRASGMVEAPEISKDAVSVTMGYGGAASAYALRQHEDLSYHHTVGGPKYLETPLLEYAKDGGNKIAARLAKDLEELGS